PAPATRPTATSQGLGQGPLHLRQRQAFARQALHRLHVGPAEQPPAVEHERLDTEAATGQFDRAILADQALLVAAIDPDDGPVRLLAAEAPRQPATWQFPGQRLDEVVGMRGEIERLYLGFGQCVAANLQ